MLTLNPEFLTGVTQFIDNLNGDSRVVIPLNINNCHIFAVVDTGAPYSVLSPDTAKDLGIDIHSGINTKPLSTSRGKFKGKLCRIAVGLDSDDDGKGISLEANFFIPIPEPGGPLWPPDLHFIGLNTFLFAIRFAIDPQHNLFYFGELV